MADVNALNSPLRIGDHQLAICPPAPKMALAYDFVARSTPAIQSRRHSMFVQLTHRQVPVEKMDVVVKAYNETMVPFVRSCKGNKAAFALTDKKTGKVIGVSVWETEADMLAPKDHPTAVTQAAGTDPVAEFYEIGAGSIG